MVAMPEEAGLIKVDELGLQPDTDEKNASPFFYGFVGKTSSDDRKLCLAEFKVDPLYGVPSVSTEPAAVATAAAIQVYNPDLVVSAGTCGGVQQPGFPLRQGDLVIPNRCFIVGRSIIIPDFQEYISSEYPMLDPGKVVEKVFEGQAKEGGGSGTNEDVKVGACGTVNSFVASDDVGLEAGVIICEMECAAEARVCHVMGQKPFTALKIISDVEPLPLLSLEDGVGTGTEGTENPAKTRQELFAEFLETGMNKLAECVKQLVESIDLLDG
ncbi:unnamed protein product [Amoebophrya sp. A25]|nr:unnamed protein product [Amoebophrya sp. A25]|eukprot:GSA25T00026832001.1